MLIDHIGAILFPQVFILRVIGRIAFPIFAFIIVEGFFHTRDIKKYLIRLGIFALVSEIPFDLAFHMKLFDFEYQNIFFTLFFGLLVIYLYETFKVKNPMLGTICMIGIAVLNEVIRADYGIFGVLLIFIFYRYRGYKSIIFIWILMINVAMSLLYSYSINEITPLTTIQIYEVLSLIFIFNYNGKKGLKLKYLFYIFYPAHLLILSVLANNQFVLG